MYRDVDKYCNGYKNELLRQYYYPQWHNVQHDNGAVAVTSLIPPQ